MEESNKSSNIESMIKSEHFNAIIDHFNTQLNSNNDSQDSSEEYESDDDTILDNYLLNRSGENIADILTKLSETSITIADNLTTLNRTFELLLTKLNK
jgi:hypothetical protein